MNIKIFSYRYAQEILQHSNYSNIYDELITICKNCPLPYYPGKSTSQPSKDIIQQMMNSYFQMAFTQNGWEAEPLATPTDYEDALRADFRKTYSYHTSKITAQIEVEFGNVSSSYRNYFKFQLSFSNNLTDIGILIVPSQHLASRIDTGVANFEKVVRELPSANLSITVPILVIGLFDTNNDGTTIDTWNVKDIQSDLNIVKGASNHYHDEHIELLKTYLQKITLKNQEAED